MLLCIENLLDRTMVAGIRRRLDTAVWEDGRATAGHQSAQAKTNQQLPPDGETTRALGDVVISALNRNLLFVSAALPARIFPPLFNRYGEGMAFGAHVDNAIRPVPGTNIRVRTDLSATLFLSDPSEYDGGELIVEDTYGSQNVKLPAGDLVLYPATSVHRVAPVTRGVRLASFFWVQSMVREDSERALLFEIDRAIAELGGAAKGNPGLVRLTSVYHNLVRKWGDV